MGGASRDGWGQSRAGNGGSAMWIGLALTHLLLTRTSKLFAEENGVFLELYCLRRGDVFFFLRGGNGCEEGEKKWRTRFKLG